MLNRGKTLRLFWFFHVLRWNQTFLLLKYPIDGTLLCARLIMLDKICFPRIWLVDSVWKFASKYQEHSKIFTTDAKRGQRIAIASAEYLGMRMSFHSVNSHELNCVSPFEKSTKHSCAVQTTDLLRTWLFNLVALVLEFSHFQDYSYLY